MRTADGNHAAHDAALRGIAPMASLLANALLAGVGAGNAQRRDSIDAASEPASTPATKPAGLLQRWFGGLDRWLHRQTMRRWEAYLAQSQNVFELEQRIRKLERGEVGRG